MWMFQGNYAEIMPTNCWRLWVYNCSCSFKVPSRLDRGNHCQSSQGWWYTVTEFLLEDRQANQFSLRAIILTNCLVSLCFHSGSCSACKAEQWHFPSKTHPCKWANWIPAHEVIPHSRKEQHSPAHPHIPLFTHQWPFQLPQKANHEFTVR